MSLRINKDNIFFILPEDRYSVSNRIDKHMAEDFTLHVRAKINADELKNNSETYIISRNGMHSGISAYKDNESYIHIIFSWWIIDKDGENVYKSVPNKIEMDMLDNFNDFTMICDNTKKEIHCYINNKHVGVISYKKQERHIYENTFYWFGCGSMMCTDEYRQIGDFTFDLAFLLNKKIKIQEVDDIAKNYNKSYTVKTFYGFRKIKDDFYLKDNLAFFCDFKHQTRYKIWDMTFSGNYPQIYIEDNIYF
jgi:hypothetical protein